jgi:hypothetical protein
MATSRWLVLIWQVAGSGQYRDPGDVDGQLRTLGLLERLRAKSGYLDRAASDLHYCVDALLRELENPNLHDIQNMTFRVELWDRHALHVRWVVAAAGMVSVALAAFDQAVTSWPDERLTPRQGIHLIREHPQPLGKSR